MPKGRNLLGDDVEPLKGRNLLAEPPEETQPPPQTSPNYRWSEKLQKFDESAGIKGDGYFGPIPTPDGGSFSTELSRDGKVGGKMIQYPLLVPLLTNEEIVVSLMGGSTDDIEHKARQWAKRRVIMGNSPFAKDTEKVEKRIKKVNKRPDGSVSSYEFMDGQRIEVDYVNPNKETIVPQQDEQELSFKQGTPPSVFSEVKDFLFMKDRAKLQARAANAITYSEIFNIPISEAEKNHDEISKMLGGEQISSMDIVGLGFMAAIGGGLAVAPVLTAVGLAGFEVMGEMESMAISAFKGEKYTLGAKKGFVDLLPEDANELTKITVDTLDFIWKGAIVGKGLHAPKFRRKIAKAILKNKPLKKLFVDKEKVDLLTDTPDHFLVKSLKPKKGVVAIDPKEMPIPDALKTEVRLTEEPIILKTPEQKSAIAEKKLSEKTIEPDKKPAIKTSVPTETKKLETVGPDEKLPLFKEIEPIKLRKNGITRSEKFKKIDEEIATAKKNKEVANQDRLEAKKEKEIHGEVRDFFKKKIKLTPEQKKKWPNLPNIYKNDKMGVPIDQLVKEGKFKDSQTLVDELVKADDMYKMFKDIESESSINMRDEKVVKGRTKFLKQRLSDYKEGNKEGVKELQSIKKDMTKEIKSLKGWENLKGKALSILRDVKESNYDKKFQELHDVYEQMIVRTTRQKLAQSILKDIPKNVDAKYRNMIESVRGNIEAKYTTDKTKERRAKTVDYLERNPDKMFDVPEKVRLEAMKTPLEDMTLKELASIEKDVKDLTARGQKELKYRKSQERFSLNKKVATFVKSIMGGKELDKTSTPVTTPKEVNKFISAIKTGDARFKRGWTLADKIDKGTKDKLFEGPFSEEIFNKTNNLHDAELVIKGGRRDFVGDFIKKSKIKLNELTVEHTFNSNNYSVSDMIAVYMHSKNKHNRDAITYLNKISPETQAKIIKALDPKYKKLGDILLEDYAKRSDPLFETTYETENRFPVKEEHYSPMVGEAKEGLSPIEEVSLEMNNRELIRPNKDMTKDRLKLIPTAVRNGIKLDAYGTWAAAVERHEHYIHFGKHVQNLNKIISHPDMIAAMEQSKSFGRPYLEAIQHNINNIANPNYNKTGSEIIRTLRKNKALYALLFNIKTMLKQAASIPLYLPDAGLKAMFESTLEFADNPVKTIKFMKDNFPQIKYRNMERETTELRVAGKGKLGKVQHKITKPGLAGLLGIDKSTVMVGTYATYLNKLRVAEKRGMAPELRHKWAVEQARNAFIRTQPQSATKDLPMAYSSGSETVNSLLQFTNQLNNNWNMGTHTIPMYLRRGEIQESATSATALALSGTIIWAINNDRFPTTKEDFKSIATETFMAHIPAVGKPITQTSKGYDTGIALFDPAKKLAQLFMRDDQYISDYVNGLLDVGAEVTGLPGVATKRGIKSIQEASIKPLLGVKTETDGRKRDTRGRKTRGRKTRKRK